MPVAAITHRVTVPSLATIPLRVFGRFRLGGEGTALVVCGVRRLAKMFAEPEANSVAGLLRMDAAGA
jgi:hypothetical protein